MPSETKSQGNFLYFYYET